MVEEPAAIHYPLLALPFVITAPQIGPNWQPFVDLLP